MSDTKLELLEAREEVMHRHLDAIGAPTHSNGAKLNINGRMYDYLRAHPDLIQNEYIARMQYGVEQDDRQPVED